MVPARQIRQDKCAGKYYILSRCGASSVTHGETNVARQVCLCVHRLCTLGSSLLRDMHLEEREPWHAQQQDKANNNWDNVNAQ